MEVFEGTIKGLKRYLMHFDSDVRRISFRTLVTVPEDLRTRFQVVRNEKLNSATFGEAKLCSSRQRQKKSELW